MPSSRFRAGLGRPSSAPAEVAWFAFHGDDLLVRARVSEDGGDRFDIPIAADLADLGAVVTRAQPLGELDGRACRSAELAQGAPAPAGYAYVSLRRLHGRIDPELFEIAGTAYQVQHWDKAHQYCAACGAALESGQDERVKRCVRCASNYFPRITPATIVLVEDGPRVLMTRQARFPAGMYGLVAGFVEPGETLEACVTREVHEETGVDVAEIVYFGSQPWPFPHQIMVGFTARYAGGDLRVDTRELEDARWFHRDALPLLPPPLSIARKLIEAWLARPAR